jgi:hypothetical protein
MTVHHIQSAMIVLRNFNSNNPNMTKWFGEDSRNFVVVVPPEHVGPMKDEGWNVKPNRNGDAWHLLVKIDPEYDTDLSHLETISFNNAEVYLEGRPWSVAGMGNGIVAFLISITPEQ